MDPFGIWQALSEHAAVFPGVLGSAYGALESAPLADFAFRLAALLGRATRELKVRSIPDQDVRLLHSLSPARSYPSGPGRNKESAKR